MRLYSQSYQNKNENEKKKRVNDLQTSAPVLYMEMSLTC